MTNSKLIRQDVAPPGGYAPVVWKAMSHKRTVPGAFIICVFTCVGMYGAYKYRCVFFEQRLGWYHKAQMNLRVQPFLYAEQDRRMLRARKQHEYDLSLIVGPDSDWDPHRRAYVNDDIFVPYTRRELLPLLTDKERVALGGEPSRYSFNDMWSPTRRLKGYLEDNGGKGKNTWELLE